MKRIFFLFTALLFILLFSGCIQSEREPDDEGKVRVVATVFPPFDFVREIAGDNAELTMLLPPGTESHSFEPTPQDIIRIRDCDIFIYTGGESDTWVEKVLGTVNTENMRIVTLMDCVSTMEDELLEGMEPEHDHENEYEHGYNAVPEYDEHVWTSPLNAKLIVQKLSDTLCEADPGSAGIYRANTSDYLAKLDELDLLYKEVTGNGAGKAVVFGDRFPFRYLAEAYGLECYGAFPGCSSETEASPATMKFLIDKIKNENISVVLRIELSNGKIAEALNAETGAKVLMLHSCHNLTKDEFDSGIGYLELMTRNAEVLRETLQ